MRIIICGAGEVGSHVAETLSCDGQQITIIDPDPDRLRAISDTMDVRTLEGNCAYGEVLRNAGAEDADLLVAATDQDEINLMTASVAKGIGVRRTVARVHHSAYFDQRGLDYKRHFSIDHLICPEYSTAQAIARALRNPAALAIEQFSRGQIEVQELPVDDRSACLGQSLPDLRLPRGTRLAAVTRNKSVFIPDAATVLEEGDRVVLVADTEVVEDACRVFRLDEAKRAKVVLMGGPSMAVWLCRELRHSDWSVRLFETDRARAEQLAEKLDWVTVLNADPTDESVFAEEKIGAADVFISLLDDDEHNIIGCVMAKSRGVPQAIAVVQRTKYLDLLYHVGVDRPFSPGRVAAQEIETVLDDSSIRHLATVATGIEAYMVRVSDTGELLGKPLRELRLAPDWVVAAVRRGDEVWVPGAEDAIEIGDSMLVIGREGEEKRLRSLFAS